MFRKLIKEQLLMEADEIRLPFKMDIPEDIRKIQKVFKSNGKELFLVGGSVRDALLGKPIKDYDLATEAKPDEVIEMLKDQPFITNIIETGKSFGVINALTDNDEYEIATFRSESGYEDSRRPSNVEFTDIATDVSRRDLTVNALFYDLDTNEVVDLVGGIEDLKKGVIKTVGDPSERFEEDKLRVLRAIRFAARFGSDVDEKIDQLLSKGIDLSMISGERIRDEFIKGIKTSKSTVNFLSMLDKYGLFNAIFPNVKINKNFIESNESELVIASLLLPLITISDISQIEKRLNTLKYSTQEIRDITALMLLTQFEPEDVVPMKKKLQLSSLSDKQIKTFASLMNLETNLIDKLLQFNLSVSGQDVMKKFDIKGPEVGKVINQIEVEKFKKTLN
jgi:tRNA nucleotidyltransferase/poly(A) polymerase